MARKKHLINVHTGTGTTEPSGASLYLGEIAVQHTPNDPGLWIKMGTTEASTDYEKFIGETEILNEFNKTNHNIPYVVQSGDTYTGSTSKYLAEAPELTGLTEGQSIIFHPKRNSTTGNTDFPSACTLDVQLADGTMTGPKILYVRGSTKATSHITGCTDIKLTYHENAQWSGTTGLSGWWVDFYYDSNSDVRAHNLYYGNAQRTITGNTLGRYRLMLSSADNEHWVPINTTTATSATAAKTITSVPIDPFGPIAYYSTTTTAATDTSPSSAYTNTKVSAFTIGYSFVTTLTAKLPVYLKCEPQSDGSAIIDSTTPFVQSLPTTEDGKIYIFLGVAATTGTCELYETHPVYEYKYGHIRLYQEDNAPEMVLGSGYTYSGIPYVNSSTTIADAYSALTEELISDEQVIAAALNNLYGTVSGLSGTSGEISALSASVVNNETRIGDVESDLYTLSGIVTDNEYVIARSLNELHSNVAALSGISTDTEAVIEALSAGTIQLSADTKSAIEALSAVTQGVLTVNVNGTAQGTYSPSADTTLNLQIVTEVTGDDVLLTGYELSSGVTEQELAIAATDTVNEAFGKIQKQNYDNEFAMSTAMNDLNVRVATISANTLPSVTVSDNGKIVQVVNGHWELVSPVSIYSGNNAPDNQLGNNGDLFLQI